ncbi:MAG: hypothetical protein ABMA64_32285 [Myxococcota bacterium]
MGSIALVLSACADPYPPIVPAVDRPDAGDLLGVTTSVTTSDTEPVPEDPCEGDPSCVDVRTIAPLWTLEPGWSSSDFDGMVHGDLNGDGLVDMVWQAAGPGGTVDTLVVFGPLVRERVLPRDADVVLVDAHLVRVGEATGDGVPDLAVTRLVDGTDHVYYVVPGPLESGSVIDAAKSGLGPWSLVTISDFDGDGTLDLIESGYPTNPEETWTFSGWRGPSARWKVGEPSLHLSQHCVSGDARPPEVVPVWDADGDGSRDMCAYDLCGAYLLPSGTSGAFTLGDPQFAQITCTGSTPAGDLTGDGVTDFHEDGSTYSWAGPLTWAANGQPTSPQIAGANERDGYLQLGGVDVDVDGYPDFLLAHPLSPSSSASYQLWLVTGGPEGTFVNGGGTLVAGIVDSQVGVRRPAWVEGGRLYWPVVSSAGVGVLEYGPVDVVDLEGR